MALTLKITDTGGTSADLVYKQDTNRKYALAKGGWAPGVAARRQGQLAGGGPYADVVEELSVHVLGDTAAECLTNLAYLARLLDQAETWAKGALAAAVLLQYQPEGGAGLRSAAIVGRAEGDETNALALPVRTNGGLAAYTIPNVRVRFRRRGLWLGTPETPATSLAADNGTIQDLTFAATLFTPAPVKVMLETPSAIGFDGLVLVAKQAGNIQIFDTSTMDATGRWVDTAEVPATGFGPKFMRLTAAAGAMGLSTNTVALPAARQVAVFALVRNNHATATWTARALLQQTYGFVSVGCRRPIGTGANQPQWIELGILATPAVPDILVVQFTASTTTGGPTLDVDALVLLDVTPDAGGYAVKLETTNSTILVIDPRALTDPTAIARGQLALAAHYGPYEGDPYLTSISNHIATLVLCTYGAYWRYYVAPDLTEFTLTATRWPAYLTPQ